MSIEWKVGDIAHRVTEKCLSSMPLGHTGEVTEIDAEDELQPICVDYAFWPFIVDIEHLEP
ncbi:hypothetical protein MOQ67_05210 [Pseudomonas sp. LY-1]